uniref:Uncharacterized protein n=1 Tax=Homalodisca liturata TaxID=320908 RepID=A0A1B6HVT9_9HEMI
MPSSHLSRVCTSHSVQETVSAEATAAASELVELDDDHYDHDEGDELTHPEGNGASRLPHDVHSVHERVYEAGQGEQAEEHERDYHIRVGQNEQEPGHQEYRDILEVVQVSSPDSFHIRVLQFHLPFESRCVLWTDEGLLSKSVYGSQQGHPQHLQDENGGVEGEPLQDGVVPVESRHQHGNTHRH